MLIWSHLLKKSLMEHFNFYAVIATSFEIRKPDISKGYSNATLYRNELDKRIIVVEIGLL